MFVNTALFGLNSKQAVTDIFFLIKLTASLEIVSLFFTSEDILRLELVTFVEVLSTEW